jgi:hypothetical protein
VTKLQVPLLWHTAPQVGLSTEGLRAMPTVVGIHPSTMSVRQYDTVPMYVNVINARKG